MTLINSIEQYLRFLQYEQGVAKTTLKSYKSYIRHFHTWLAENGYPSPALGDFNSVTVKRFFYYVCAKGIRPRSIHGYILPLRSFGAYLLNQNLIPENPALAVRLPKKDAAIRQETSEAEIATLLLACSRLKNEKKVALQTAVIATFVYTGIRRAELCDLKLTDVDLSGDWLLVRSGKGSKSRKIPLCAEVKDALVNWIQHRPASVSPHLFLVDSRRRIYFEGVRLLLLDVKYRAGLGNQAHITPHSIRHACASRLMRNGASLHEVMTWLGHSEISTTQRYLHTNEEQLKEIASLAGLGVKREAEAGKPVQREENQKYRLRRVSVRKVP